MFNNPDDYLVVDLETTVRNTIGNNRASPHFMGNECVLVGLGNGAGEEVLTLAQPWAKAFKSPNLRVVVGHNLPFDAQWLLRMGVDISKFNTWDTALAEYILSGQEMLFPSLDKLCEQYGLPVKDDEVKKAWAAGLDTTDIPEHVLAAYCKQDVVNTRVIFLAQIERAHHAGCLKLLMMLNEAQMACTHMMYNGMHVDQPTLAVLQRACANSTRTVVEAFNLWVAAHLRSHSLDPRTEISISSPKDVGVLLFGGEITTTIRVPAGVYKTGALAGKPKTKPEAIKTVLPRLVDPARVGAAAGAHGFSTADEVLQNVVALGGMVSGAAFPANYVVNWRGLSKQLSTYYNRITELCFPDSCIHHNINTTATKTGRYSSSDPNLQNQTAVIDGVPGIKHCFSSRFGADGYIVELDFKQLEIVALAELSQDRQLIQDIADEVDIHTKLYMSLHHTVPDKEQRRQFKRAAFAMLYGASAKRISEITGLDKDVAKRFIGAWGKRYPATVTYWNNHADRVKLCRVPSDRRSEDGRPLGISSVPAATGRILTYYEYANQWTGKASFSPTELRNYPIQSFATGDIVPALIARLFRALQSRELLKDRAVLVNTVHDSVELDVHKDSLKEVIELIRKVEHSIPRILKEDLNIDVKCQYRLGISYGPNWGEQTEVE